MKTALHKVLAAILFLAVTNASGFCFKEAGERYSVDPLVLYAIAKQESRFNPNAYNRNNKDGSYDIGLMQINSSHLDELAAFGIAEKDLAQNPCLNVQVGAWILSRNLAKYRHEKDGFWSAVGAYNAGTSKQNHNKRMDYAWAIYNHMETASK